MSEAVQNFANYYSPQAITARSFQGGSSGAVAPDALSFRPDAEERRMMSLGGRDAALMIVQHLHSDLTEAEAQDRAEKLAAWWLAWVTGPEPVLPAWTTERPDVA